MKETISQFKMKNDKSLNMGFLISSPVDSKYFFIDRGNPYSRACRSSEATINNYISTFKLKLIK